MIEDDAFEGASYGGPAPGSFWAWQNSLAESDRTGTWPLDSEPVHVRELGYRLARAAQYHAHQSVDLWRSTDFMDQLQSAVSVGAAAEFVLKSLLAEASPVLLAGADHHSSRAMTINGPSSVGSAFEFRSITATDAVKQVRALHPGLKQTETPYFAVRNAATHMAMTHPDKLTEAIGALALLLDELLPLLHLNPDEFWGEFHDTVQRLAGREADHLEALVQQRIAASLARIEQIRAIGDPLVAPRLFWGEAGEIGSYQEFIECPACGYTTAAVWSFAADHDSDDPNPASPSIGTAVWPRSMLCAVCHLELETPAQLAIVGIEGVRHVSPEEQRRASQ